jgi:hypothetical protein
VVDSVWQFKAVKPKQLSIGAVRANILNALKEEGKYAVSLLNQTTENWNGKPQMTYDIGYKGGNVALIAGPTGDEFNVKKWHWLNAGTRVRWARMSRDWRSKTAPGSLRSGQGKGNVEIAGRKAGPHPGIAARGWTGQINKMMRKGFHRRIQRAVTDGIRRTA